MEKTAWAKVSKATGYWVYYTKEPNVYDKTYSRNVKGTKLTNIFDGNPLSKAYVVAYKDVKRIRYFWHHRKK